MAAKRGDPLSPAQQSVYDAIVDHMRSHGRPPTVLELSGVFGVRINCIAGHLKIIEAKGKIVRSHDGSARGIALVVEGHDDACPVCGRRARDHD